MTDIATVSEKAEDILMERPAPSCTTLPSRPVHGQRTTGERPSGVEVTARVRDLPPAEPVANEDAKGYVTTCL